MATIQSDQAEKIEQNFHELIVERCRFCGFDKFLAENPEFELPKLAEKLLHVNEQSFISVPGLFGGFAYCLDEVDDKLMLYAEQSSRMDHDSDDYSYFEVTEDGYRLLDSGEREAARKKFWELARKAHEKHKWRLMEK